MPVWLLHSLRAELSHRLIVGAARELDESEGNVREAMTVALNVIVAALAIRADDAAVMRHVASLFPGQGSDEHAVAAMGPRPLGDPAFAAARDAGEALLALLLAGRRDAIASAIAEHTAVRTESVWSILAWSAPVVLAELARRIRAGTTPVGLWAMFQAQRTDLTELVPNAIVILLQSAAVAPRPGTSWLRRIVAGARRDIVGAWRGVARDSA